MKEVCARARNNIDLSAGVATNFHVVRVGLNLKLANTLRYDIDSGDGDAEVVVVGSVNREIVIASALAVG